MSIAFHHATVLGDSDGVVNSLDVCPASLKSLGCFYFRCVLSSQWKAVTVNSRILYYQRQRHFLRPVVIMCLEISNNLLLVLSDAPKRIIYFLFFYELAISWSAPKRRKDTFCSPSIPFPRYFLQLQQYWHLYCFAILVSTSTVIHNAYSEIIPEVRCDLSRLLARKITKCIHSSKPASLNRLIGPCLRV